VGGCEVGDVLGGCVRGGQVEVGGVALTGCVVGVVLWGGRCHGVWGGFRF